MTQQPTREDDRQEDIAPLLEGVSRMQWVLARLRQIAWRGGCLLLVLLLLYAGAVVVGWWPVNRGFQHAADGIELFVYVDAAHSEVIVPLVTEVRDWRPWFAASDFSQLTGRENFVGFSWGDREFFLHTPRWENVRADRLAWAMFWPTPTVMHVILSECPAEGPRYRRMTVTREQYQQLVDFLQNSFQLDTAGTPQLIAARGYGRSDAFYEAQGIYSLFYTCNVWTSDALQVAGIRTGWWTPFPLGIQQMPPAPLPPGR